MYLRYWVFNEDNELIRKMASRIECEPYLKTGCTLFIAPKIKQNLYEQAMKLVGEARF